MILRQWAAEYGVPFGAILALEQRLGLSVMPAVQATGEPGRESRQQSLIRLRAAEKGMYLWRNNVGALQDKRGIPVRYGLANESAKQNAVLKSADLIGWESVVITPEMVGRLVAVFLSVEAKEEGWVYTGTEHEQAQLAWANLVISKGGRALFATGPDAL